VERPHRIASLTLYELPAFNRLKAIGAHGAAALAEILAIATKPPKRYARASTLARLGRL
jgi:hypothetical protein